MKLHSVLITHNRLELTQQAISSYLETVSVPFSLMIVDNASQDGTAEWLSDELTRFFPSFGVILLPRNVYPGPACNLGWSKAPPDATHLHRADNDFAFLPEWCENVQASFHRKVGQVGLRTNEEELFAKHNVGGNCVILKELWDQGLRYDERPWEEYPPGWSEDSLLSPAVREMGYKWTRVSKPCIRSLSKESWDDPYYQASWNARGMYRPEDSAPATR